MLAILVEEVIPPLEADGNELSEVLESMDMGGGDCTVAGGLDWLGEWEGERSCFSALRLDPGMTVGWKGVVRMER